jgi:hypothetical protein
MSWGGTVRIVVHASAGREGPLRATGADHVSSGRAVMDRSRRFHRGLANGGNAAQPGR